MTVEVSRQTLSQRNQAGSDPIQRQLHVDPCAGVEMLANHSAGLDRVDVQAETSEGRRK
jgi:hypothetical protein